MIRRALLATLASLVILAPVVRAQPTDELDWRDAPNALGLALEAASEPGSATFRWRLAAGGEPVTCRLDADGDGRFDHVLADCAGRKALRHAFARSGVYHATLLAESRDGRAGIARTTIAVAAE